MCTKFDQNQRGFVEDITKTFGVFYFGSRSVVVEELINVFG